MKTLQRFKVLIIGETNVGKTSIVSRFVKGDATSSVNNTIGIDFVSTTITIDNAPIRMQIWDTAGQERYRSITKAYYRGAQGVFIVFDLSNQKSFSTVNKWIESLNAEADAATPKILVGNKSDKFGKSELVEAENLYRTKARELNISFIPVSAYNGFNIDKIFFEMGRMLTDSQGITDSRDTLSFKTGSRNKRCC